MGDDNLKVLFPGVEVPLSNGETIAVAPLRFSQIPAASLHLNAVISAALTSGVMNEAGELDVSRLAELMARVGEPLFALILLCSGKDRDWLDLLSIEDGIDLAAAVVQVNWRPELAKKLQAMAAKMMQQTGLSPLTDSSRPAIAGETSRDTP